MAILDEPQHNGNAEPTASVGASGDQRVDALLSGIRWESGAITYSDPNAAGDYPAGYMSDGDGDGVSAQNEGFSQLSAAQLLAVHFALDDFRYSGAQLIGSYGFAVESLTNLETAYAGSGLGSGTIRVANTSDASTAYAYYPGSSIYGGDAWFGPNTRTPVAGNYSWATTLHELGHALGLKHGHETGGFGTLPGNVDSLEFSVMTYRTFIGDNTSGYNFEQWGAPQTYMMLDIAALQHMYGANFSTNADNTTYSWTATGSGGAGGETLVNDGLAINPGANRIFATIWDGGGIDTYDLSNYTSILNIDLRAGAHSIFDSAQLANLGGGPNSGRARGNIFNALMYEGDTRSLIENANGGSGADNIYGNQTGNALAGNAGNDTLVGGGGDDSLGGGAGADTITGDFPATSLGFSGGYTTLPQGATNTATATALNITNNFSLAADSEIENASTVPHSTVNAVGNGSAGYYRIDLGVPAEVTVDIDHTSAALDSYVRLLNGTGTVVDFNDDASVDPGSASDQDSRFVYTAFAGTYYVVVGSFANQSSVPASASYELNVSVRTSDFGGGAAGNDTLDGGSGADTLVGGPGNDTYYVDNWQDHTIEGSGGGADSVIATLDFELEGNVENLTYAGASAFLGVGNELANTITGGPGNDELFGWAGNDTLSGGSGNDILRSGPDADMLNGGPGNDTYYVDNWQDHAIEGSGGGADSVIATLDFELEGNVENLTYAGASAFLGVGNELANTITGGPGNDLLYGHGGNDTLEGSGGADTLSGGAGNDTYYVDNWQDHTIEGSGGGADSVIATLDFELEGNVENLTYAGASAFLGVGNELANTITGGPGNDELFGWAGNDTLSGGSGNDILRSGPDADMLNGGPGNDTYYVDNWQDHTIEGSGGGADSVIATLDFELEGNVENLTYAGASAFLGVGNELANTITGGPGNDELFGWAGNDTLRGGGGNDVLRSGPGADMLVFNTPLNAALNVDTVTDFTPGSDRLLLNQVLFSGPATGVLAAANFVAEPGAVAHDANDYILYNTATGAVSYDADGSGAQSAIRFAMLANQPSLTAQDVQIGPF